MHLGLYVCCSPLLLLSHLLTPRSDSPDLVRGAGTDLACGTTSVGKLLWQENCFQKLSREWNVLICLTFSQIRKRPCGAVCLAGNKNLISFLPYFLRQSWDFNSFFSTQLACKGRLASQGCCDRCAVLLQLGVPARIEAERTVSLVPLNRDVKT